jgi:hypothetical protein
VTVRPLYSTTALVFGIIGAVAAPAIVPINPAAAADCRPVRYYSYALPADVALACSPVATMAFDIVVPDRGRFLVRADLRLRGTGTVGEQVHGWSARWASLGDPAFPSRIAHAAGEDICTGETRDKGMLGFGRLEAARNRVALTLNAYRSEACENAAVTVAAGSSLTLWVEDPDPRCQGRDIAAFSYFDRQAATHGDVGDRPAALDASPRTVIDGSIVLTEPAQRLAFLGQTEISPPVTANSCSQRPETGAAWLYVNGAAIAGSYWSDSYPPSAGMTHLLLTPASVLTPARPGLYRFGLAAAVNQIGPQPAIIGTRVSGDSIVAGIVFRQQPAMPRDRPPAMRPDVGTLAPPGAGG